MSLISSNQSVRLRSAYRSLSDSRAYLRVTKNDDGPYTIDARGTWLNAFKILRHMRFRFMKDNADDDIIRIETVADDMATPEGAPSAELTM